MNDRSPGTHVLTVDDDPDIRGLVTHYLRADGMRVTEAGSAEEARAAIRAELPDLVLLDVVMPGTDGFELCRELMARPDLSSLPIVFLTASGSEQDKAAALSAGGIGYLVKPFTRDSLTTAVRAYFSTAVRFSAITESERSWSERLVPDEFVRFKEHLASALGAEPDLRRRIEAFRPSDLYVDTGTILTVGELAGAISEFLDVPLVRSIPADDVDLGVLPSAFCRSNLVVPTSGEAGPALVVANPFNWQLLDTVERFSMHQHYQLHVAEPGVIIRLLSGAQSTPGPAAEADTPERVHRFGEGGSAVTAAHISPEAALEAKATDSSPITFIANNIIVSAATQHASDVHIEPKESMYLVRFRIDGDMRDFLKLKRSTGAMLISRFKVVSGLDIAEKRKPQDGSMEAVVDGLRYKLRLATTSTPHGESLILRLLEADARPKLLSELGMTAEQETKMVGFANRSHGLICVVGPTGSGKTTTIYSLISQVDADKRSIITIEDPVEYRIAKANQQQVNDKAGVTFESLLRSVVRQDPDVMFLGEIRDPYSAKMSMDFASTGHLTITSLHTTNATTALFRFERLGVSRDVMAEALLAVVAQRLIKRLCPECKQVEPVSDQERAWMEPFTDDVPQMVAHPVGCKACANTGYAGREAVNEIFEFDPAVQQLVRDGVSVPQIREFVRRRGDYLIYDHAIDKVRDLLFAPVDVWNKVLVEEAVMSPDDAGADEGFYSPESASPSAQESASTPAPSASSAAETATGDAFAPLILIVDDDPDARALLGRMLQRADMEVIHAPDGGTALLELGRRAFDLVISDLEMPGLGGFMLLEIMAQQGVSAPVMLLTASDEVGDEAHGFELGAVDFMHKPIAPDVLVARVRRALASIKRTAP